MMTWHLLYFLIFLAGLVAALALTPCFRALAIRCDLIGRRNWEAFFSALSRCTLQKRGSTMQAGPSFFDLYHVTDVKSLKIREAWETNLVRDHIRSLIGIDSCPFQRGIHHRNNVLLVSAAGQFGHHPSVLLMHFLAGHHI